VRRFAGDYPGWRLTYDIRRILIEMHEQMRDRLDAGTG
jgi:hypothetical protein